MELPPIVFGCMAHHGGGDDASREGLLRAAADAGYRAFDTAPLYGFGASEEVLGRALRGRDDVLVLSKVGLSWDGDHGDVLFATPTHTVRKDSRPESVLREIDLGLERLGRSRIDLIQVHHPDVHVPIAETMDALREAHAAGKVGAIGVSNYSAAQMREAATALGDVGLFSTQDQYNLLERDAEREQLPACRELGCGFLCFSPLSQGLLAGSLLRGRRLAEDDWRSAAPKHREKNLAAIHAALESTMAPIAEAHGATLAQIALAWLLAEPEVTSVIAGARTIAHAEANLAAAEPRLSDAERARLRRAFEAIHIDEGLGRRERARRLAKRGLGKLRRLLGRSR
ncbi:MAG: aldo/keto reductase [Sandaracinaceae bacterium]